MSVFLQMRSIWWMGVIKTELSLGNNIRKIILINNNNNNNNNNNIRCNRSSGDNSVSTPTTTSSTKPMDNNNNNKTSGDNNNNNINTVKSNTNVVKMQQLLHNTDSSNSGGWEKCWVEGLTPWDLGKPTPVLVHLHHTESLPKGRALIPGCGSGYDVFTIACPERYVVGLDISEKAIEKAKELSAPLRNADNFTFLKHDFFTWQPFELFDLIFDYTFFCAIDPDLRSSWAIRMRDLLKPDGELITLIFPISDHLGGPPYKVCISDYEEVLHPVGFKAISIVDNELAVGARKGREKLGRWKKVTGQSLL